MNYHALIEKYYPEDDALRQLLITHSQSVAQFALQIVSLHPELGIDRQFVLEAAMLHDIGIRLCDAPGIHCHGTEPYIRHGRIGAEWLRTEGFPRHARVCERHTGAGITCRHHMQADSGARPPPAPRGFPPRDHRGTTHLLRRQILQQVAPRETKDRRASHQKPSQIR